jgi:PKD repeat protein
MFSKKIARPLGAQFSEGGPRCISMSRSSLSLAVILAFCGLLCISYSSQASDYVLVVDTSGSMIGPVSSQDSRIRIKVVQNALTDFFSRLPPNNRVYLISFNNGIKSYREFFIKNNTYLQRQSINQWINGLEGEARKNGGTYLCSTVRRALEIASRYAVENPSQPVTVWILTDGGDNEPGPGTESGTPIRLNKVLEDFPSVDENSIKANLTIIGDLALTMTSEKSWFRIRNDTKFENLVPPVIKWTPDQPKVGATVTFTEDSPADYQFYDWRIDGNSAGFTKILKTNLAVEGSHEVHLIVTTANGDKLTDTKRIIILPKALIEKLKADFVIIPSRPEPNQPVQLTAIPEGNVSKYIWYVDGTQVASTEIATNTFDKEGKFEIKLHVENENGSFDDKVQNVSVAESPLVVQFIADSEAKSGQNVRFANETTGGEVETYNWDFGDGAQSNEKDPSHVYEVIGTEPKLFAVVLQAKTHMGKLYSSEPFQLKVWPTPPKPTAIAQASTNWVRVGSAIQFVSQSTGLVERVMWQFNGESSSTEPSPLYAFRTSGTNKEVILTVEGPGGSDSVKLYVTVANPQLAIGLRWIDNQGQNEATPKIIDFDEIPPAHVKSGEYPRPPYDSFDVIIPADLPSSGGMTIIIGEKATSAVELIHHLPDSEQTTPVSGLIRESGRYQLRIRHDAGEGEYSDNITFNAQGQDVLLNGGTTPVQVPIQLRIGTSGGGMFGLFMVFLALLVAVFLGRQILRKKPPVPINKPMEAVLQEISLGGDGKPTPVQILPPKTFILSRNQHIHLGDSPGLAPTDQLFDLGMPLGFLLRQELGLKLHRSVGGKDELLNHNGEFKITDGKNKKRIVKLTMRPVADIKPGSQKPLK